MLNRGQIKSALNHFDENFNNYDCDNEWINVVRECLTMLSDYCDSQDERTSQFELCYLMKCPCCGNDANETVEDNMYYVYCPKCFLSTKSLGFAYSKEEHIEVWNNRTISKQNFELTNNTNNDTELLKYAFNILTSSYQFESEDVYQQKVIELIRQRLNQD